MGEGPRVCLLGRFCSAVDYAQTRRQTCTQKAHGELSTTFILRFIGYCFYLFRLKNPQKRQGGFFFFFILMSTAAVHITTSQLRFVERKGCPKELRTSWQHLVEWTCSQRTKIRFSKKKKIQQNKDTSAAIKVQAKRKKKKKKTTTGKSGISFLDENDLR